MNATVCSWRWYVAIEADCVARAPRICAATRPPSKISCWSDTDKLFVVVFGLNVAAPVVPVPVVVVVVPPPSRCARVVDALPVTAGNSALCARLTGALAISTSARAEASSGERA